MSGTGYLRICHGRRTAASCNKLAAFMQEVVINGATHTGAATMLASEMATSGGDAVVIMMGDDGAEGAGSQSTTRTGLCRVLGLMIS